MDNQTIQIIDGKLLAQAKSYLSSRTIWGNVAGFILAPGFSWLVANNINLSADDKATILGGLTSLLLVVFNIAMRFLQTQPIALALPGNAPAVPVPAAKIVKQSLTIILLVFAGLSLVSCGPVGKAATTVQADIGKAAYVGGQGLSKTTT